MNIWRLVRATSSASAAKTAAVAFWFQVNTNIREWILSYTHTREGDSGTKALWSVLRTYLKELPCMQNNIWKLQKWLEKMNNRRWEWDAAVICISWMRQAQYSVWMNEFRECFRHYERVTHKYKGCNQKIYKLLWFWKCFVNWIWVKFSTS